MYRDIHRTLRWYIMFCQNCIILGNAQTQRWQSMPAVQITVVPKGGLEKSYYAMFRSVFDAICS